MALRRGPDGGVLPPVHQRPAGALFVHADRCEAHGVADINAQQFVSPQPRQQHRHHQGPFAYGPGQIAVFARLDDAHARLIVIYACNIRRDRAPPRRASVRIFQARCQSQLIEQPHRMCTAISCPQVLQLVDACTGLSRISPAGARSGETMT